MKIERVPFARLIRSMRNGLSPATEGTFRGEVLTLGAITHGSFDSTQRKEAMFGQRPHEDQVVRPGTFLVCRGNGNLRMVGAGLVVPEGAPAGIVYPDTMICADVDECQLDVSYLQHAWATSGVRSQIEAGARTTNGTHKVNQQALEAVLLPLPPLTEQRRIAVILDKADAIRRKRREGIRLTDDMLRSAFYDVFGDIWSGRFPLAPIAALGAVKVGRMRTPKHQSGKFTKPYLRVANVHLDELRLEDVLSMDFTPEECETFRLAHGDVLLNEGQSTELVGRPAMWRDELPECYFQNSLIRFRSAPDVTVPEYALDLFLDLLRRGVFAANSAKTSNMAHLGGGRFAAISVPVPPLPIQRRWAGIRESIRLARLRMHGAAIEDESLGRALADRAFSGEV